MKYYENISLGFGEEENGTLYAKQFDDGTRRVRFTMMDGNGKALTNAQLTTWHYYYRMLCPNGAQIHSDTCLTVDGDNLILTFDENMLASAGMATADILVSSDDDGDGNFELISTCSFQIFIDPAPFTNRAIEASQDFATLKTMMQDIDKLRDNINQVEANLTAGERTRINNENNRVAAEAQREADFDDIKDTTTGLIAQAEAARNDSITAKNEATDQALLSKSWAVGGTGISDPDRVFEDTDNSKYYSSLSESWVHGNTTTGRVNENTDNAEYYSKIAQSFANGTSGVRTGETVDNAKYYSDLAKASENNVATINADVIRYNTTFQGYLVDAGKAVTDAQDAQGKAETARDDAVTAKNDAETAKNATDKTKSDIDTIKSAIDQAKIDVDQYKIDAQTAKSEAVTAKGQAEGFLAQANAARDKAVDAQVAAEAAAGQASVIAGIGVMKGGGTSANNGFGRPDDSTIRVRPDGMFYVNPDSSLAKHASGELVTNGNENIVHGVRIYKEADGLYDIEHLNVTDDRWDKIITSPRIMTDTTLGIAKVDGKTIKVDADGTLHGGATGVDKTQAEYDEMESKGEVDPETIYFITDAYSDTDGVKASNMSYNNTISGLAAIDVQNAIDELAELVAKLVTKVGV